MAAQTITVPAIPAQAIGESSLPEIHANVRVPRSSSHISLGGLLMKLNGATTQRFVLIAMLTMVNIAVSPAQSGTSSALSGTVTDQNGAVIADARATAAEVDTGATRSAKTDSEGRYLFSQINPGSYRVTVHAEGFADAVSDLATVDVGRTVTLNLGAAA